MDVSILPGAGHDFHRHPTQEELIIVGAGEIEQWLGEKSRVLGPGDSAYVDPGLVHASFNTTSETAHLLVVISPSVQTPPGTSWRMSPHRSHGLRSAGTRRSVCCAAALSEPRRSDLCDSSGLGGSGRRRLDRPRLVLVPRRGRCPRAVRPPPRSGRRPGCRRSHAASPSRRQKRPRPGQ